VSVRQVTAVLLIAGALSASAGVARAGWWDDLDRGVFVQLDDVVLHPSRYRDQILTFFCVFRQTDQIFAPLAAPFQPQRYENLAVWPDGTPVWEKEAYTKDYPFLYISRAHPQHPEIVRMEEFTRLEVTGRIRGMIRARPCIEILSFRRTGQPLGNVVVQSVIRGDRYSELGELDLAYENYRRALTPDLPPTYDLHVRRRLADALRRLGRGDEARVVEGGPILGAGGAPEAQPRPPGGLLGDPLPGTPGTTTPSTAPPPVATDLPGQPLKPGPISQDLPGRPAGEAPPAAFPPPTAPSSPSAPAPGTPGGPPPPIARDLPGQPAPGQGTPGGPPPPIARDLPGQPAPGQGAPGGPPPPIARDLPGQPAPSGQPAPPPIVKEVPDEDEDEEEAEEPPPPPPPPPPGAPPRRAPRLTGVK